MLIATSKYGAGVSSDSVHNMAAADNLLHGKGFFDHTGMPLVWWPPLFPLMMAALSVFTRGDVFVAGWYLNLVLFGVNVFLNGVLVRRAFTERPLFQYLGVLFVLVSDTAIRVHANIASEPLFVTFSLIFLIAACEYVENQSRRSFWVMVAMSALAPLQRWLGLSLIAAGVSLILYVRPPSFFPPIFGENAGRWRGVRESFLFAILSILPIAAWVIFHNELQYGTLWGTGEQIVNPLMNLQMSLGKMLHWFLPYHPLIKPLLFQPWIPLGLILIILLLINRKTDWQAWGQALMKPSVFTPAFFFVMTLLGLMFTIVTGDHLDPTSDRYYVGLLAPVIILFFVTWDILILPHVRVSPRLRGTGFLFLFLVWFFAYPGWSAAKYLSDALERGEPSNYNYYNNLVFHENPLIPQMEQIARDNPSAALYSNYSDGVWFFTRRPSPSMPRVYTSDPAEIAQKLAGWPPQDGYIFWFLPNEYKSIAPPEMIAQFANVKLLFDSKEGQVYRLTRK